jgi:CHAD domain-containing protein
VRVFGAVLQPEPARALDVELRWYAGLLGEVRDRQVLRQRLERMASDVDDTLLLGPVKARIDTELRREQREHWDRLLEELTGERYLALLEAAADFVREPPFAAAAHRRASCLSSRVRRAEQKLARTLKRAIATGDAQQLHAARKAAKRARYATEAAGSVLGTRHAATRAKRYQRLQDLLGEHQDSLVSSELLRRLGATAGTIDGENGFAFGILHEREQRNARIARKKARKAAARWS